MAWDVAAAAAAAAHLDVAPAQAAIVSLDAEKRWRRWMWHPWAAMVELDAATAWEAAQAR
ncbi:hypothetical protein SORBI_3001G267000 [Sorghum bicolor]|uniref:Uncharacterized protein n=1 Tax=Sorghum bicolor TaxID=4558 RepID=A0A1B6QLA9_SORBI|nr:hypothetical protein SORBI_3001G267000 [Sorghum bicolor]KXG38686.1 hypothetical protein SORBI_3001G267000 [Sorghum bicolor]KXG38687.1 hypothetical protein SORBI_3001G267000 [Sorghum bicolor]